MAEEKYYQCYMEKDIGNEVYEIKVGWIPERGAKKGARIELIGEEGRWEVKSVSSGAFEKTKLIEKQNFDRRNLLSIKD